MVFTKRNDLDANMAALAIAVIVFLVLFLLKPDYPFQPYGITLPMVQKLPEPTGEHVIIYQIAPVNAQKLAYVNIEGHSATPNKIQQFDLLDYAKQLAQKAGGNGLVIRAFGYQGADNVEPAPLTHYVLQAIVIKV